jgi:hypothetical protein
MGACLCRDIEVPDEGPAVVSALIDECLQPNPAKRPSAAAICERIEVCTCQSDDSHPMLLLLDLSST